MLQKRSKLLLSNTGILNAAIGIRLPGNFYAPNPKTLARRLR